MSLALDKMFTQAVVEKGTFDDAERTFVAWASKPVLDRDGEIIASDAWDVKSFKKNPVLLWAHNYDLPPVGKVLWSKQSKDGMQFKPKFAPTDMGQELYMLYKEGFLNTFSVGFIPKDYEESKKTVEFIDWFGDKYEKPIKTYTDVELLEISCVPVPSCPLALVERMAGGGIKTKGLQVAIRATASKAVIPFEQHDLADEEADWDSVEEQDDAQVEDLMIMSAWHDPENPDTKSSYKLLHHRADRYTTVWNGVAEAMMTLLGGNGGVDIPDSDRRSVYEHLSRHYEEFEQPVPEFKHYTETELKNVVKIAGMDIEGAWEAMEVDEFDPIDRIREEGLAKEKDGIVPVTVELWNTIMDNTKLLRSQIPDKDNSIDESDENVVEYTEEEFDLMVKQELQIKRQQEMIQKLSHKFAEVNGKLRVLQGGIG